MSLDDDISTAFRTSVAAVKLAEAVLATVPAENKMLHRLARRVLIEMRRSTKKRSVNGIHHIGV